MNLEEIATKKDLAEMEQRIIQALSSKKLEKDKPLDMDEAADYIHAKRSTLYKLTAAGEIVRIPLSENALRFMPKRGAKANLVFDLGPLNTFSRKLKEWANEAGITKNIHFHMSRHSFATLALSNGADLYTVSKLLGHREVTTTQVYAKVLDEGRKKAVDAIPDLLTEHNQLTPANQETL